MICVTWTSGKSPRHIMYVWCVRVEERFIPNLSTLSSFLAPSKTWRILLQCSCIAPFGQRGILELTTSLCTPPLVQQNNFSGSKMGFFGGSMSDIYRLAGCHLSGFCVFSLFFFLLEDTLYSRLLFYNTSFIKIHLHICHICATCPLSHNPSKIRS